MHLFQRMENKPALEGGRLDKGIRGFLVIKRRWPGITKLGKRVACADWFSITDTQGAQIAGGKCCLWSGQHLPTHQTTAPSWPNGRSKVSLIASLHYGCLPPAKIGEALAVSAIRLIKRPLNNTAPDEAASVTPPQNQSAGRIARILNRQLPFLHPLRMFVE